MRSAHTHTHVKHIHTHTKHKCWKCVRSSHTRSRGWIIAETRGAKFDFPTHECCVRSLDMGAKHSGTTSHRTLPSFETIWYTPPTKLPIIPHSVWLLAARAISLPLPGDSAGRVLVGWQCVCVCVFVGERALLLCLIETHYRRQCARVERQKYLNNTPNRRRVVWSLWRARRRKHASVNYMYTSSD